MVLYATVKKIILKFVYNNKSLSEDKCYKLTWTCPKITQTHVQKKSPTQELLFSGEEKVAQINECKFRWIDGVSTS